MASFTVGLNHKIQGKTHPSRLSYPGAWQNQTITFTGLAEHHSQGHPWMPALLDGNRKRWQSNANRAEVLGLDIDEGMTIEEAGQHPFVRIHAGLGIESASSSPEHHKFRLAFLLPHPVEDWKTIRICNRYLATLIEVADPACKDASRFFFGAAARNGLEVWG